MKKNILMLGMIAVFAMLSMEAVSAIVPNVAPYANGVAYGYGSYGSYPVNPSLNGRFIQNSYPARVGGAFGANSAFIIGLRPGFADSPVMNIQNRQRLSNQYYTRTGGYFGGYRQYPYFNLNPGTIVFNGNTANSNFVDHDIMMTGPM
ncbi:MAG: hypothetical protein V1866_06305 [archaeon]